MAVPGYVIKHRRTTLERAEKFLSTDYFTDCNLRSRLFKRRTAVTTITHYAAPGRISYQQAVNQGTFTEVTAGQRFGPAFSTHWFRLEINVPESWIGEEVTLVWDSWTEAMVWRDGQPLQGLSPEAKRTNFIISRNLQESERRQMIYIEMAGNGLFGAGATADGGIMINPPQRSASTVLRTVDLVVIDRDVESLIRDFEILIGICKYLPENCNRNYQALYLANEMVNTIDIGNRESYKKAHELATSFFSLKNGDTQHTVKAVGNCHIDTAWLWPYDETKRKCARSFSSTIRLLEQYPQYTFACSQAQQFEWVQENYPSLFQEIKHYVAEGRFIPVGGCWVEMDGNIPSGEAFVRQFLLGQTYFKETFGTLCQEFWLPDTFGYSAQLPQIMKGAGITRFVTQKISWSLVNKFPHHTFWWKGIDGSEVLTHFPPGDSYGMKGNVEEIMKTINNFADKGRSNSSLYLYGFGDGGQGPTEEIIERLVRMNDIDGLPRVEFSTPDKYFTEVEAKDAAKLCHWNGELYLELHNGTYTTQAQVKKWNRLTEFLLRDAEILSSFATTVSRTKELNFQYPAAELKRLWKLVLLNQFHDVLPGTSISDVYEDAVRYYEDVQSSSSQIISSAVGSVIEAQGQNLSDLAIFNTLSWSRTELISLKPDHIPGKVNMHLTQTDADGNVLALVKVAAFGYSVLAGFKSPTASVSAIEENDGCIRLKNNFLEAAVDKTGRIVELYTSLSRRNIVAPGQYANQLVIFDDIPLYWDAWDVMDYHLETRKVVTNVSQSAKIVESGPLRATVEVSWSISDVSVVKQRIIIEADCPYIKFTTEVDWHESHKFLKVEFPVSIVSTNATYEIQFGHLQRPTHFNTSWDWARFEVCGHKWADVSEYDWGLAVLNDSKYGWSCIDNVLRLSLLRSPKAPDDNADMGLHRFTYALMPHTGTFQSAGVVQAAYSLNNKLRSQEILTPYTGLHDFSFVTVDQPAVVIAALKQSESDAGKLVLRMYEAYGSHATANVHVFFPFKSCQMCNLLESPLDGSVQLPVSNGSFVLDFSPFQIISVLLSI